MNKHFYTLQLNWVGDPAIDNVKNDRIYQINIPNKVSFKGSADATFHGDPKLMNPEDMLLSSLSACHMMSYFYVCRKEGIIINSYSDNPIGTLQVNPDGSGQFKKVVLKPLVKLGDKMNVSLAKSLHDQASKLCFIANSCSFDIEIDSTFL